MKRLREERTRPNTSAHPT